MTKKVMVRFIQHTCSYKKGQLKRVCIRVAKAWERKKIVSIVRPVKDE